MNYFCSIIESMTQTLAFDGKVAQCFELHNDNGMTASFMDIGATWLSCTLPLEDGQREVLLRHGSLEGFYTQGGYMGAVVGRFANRIAKGEFTLEGIDYKLDINNGVNSLHGGLKGFDKHRWVVENQSQNSITFVTFSEDGDQNYPGKVAVRLEYILTESNALELHYRASTDKTTPLNLTNHAYFNLDGEASGNLIFDHQLMIDAPEFLPIDHTQIPTGEKRNVKGTTFDFTSLKTIGQDFLKEENQTISAGYDHAFILNKACRDGKETVIKAISSDRKVTMKVATTKPSVQFYAGNFLKGTLGGTRTYEANQGFCLETQYLPDGPNHPEWQGDNGVYSPEQAYQHKTVYAFDW
ncbi:galactose-1-epimerase [Vibrio sp.]|nr:galactose-1-epimerase [Vibrio sp.]